MRSKPRKNSRPKGDHNKRKKRPPKPETKPNRKAPGRRDFRTIFLSLSPEDRREYAGFWEWLHSIISRF